MALATGKMEVLEPVLRIEGNKIITRRGDVINTYNTAYYRTVEEHEPQIWREVKRDELDQ